MILCGDDAFSLEYNKGKNTKNIWIVVETDDNKYFLQNFDDWLKFKGNCDRSSVKLKSVGLQYKSHHVQQDVSKADGAYLIRSVKANFGGDSIDTFVTGVVNGNKVTKIMWSIPALIPEDEFVEKIEECFEEAIIYHNGKQET
tara:strand:- start:43 stop:471 length:429 start_codon:yes stop_codon:yes gene_type:complete